MTLDELLQQLMKIKEVYPDSGKFLITGYDEEYRLQNGGLYPISSVKVDKHNHVVMK